jgi:hypothetical protein
LEFGKLILPEGDPMEVSATLVAVDAIGGSRLVLDSEGMLRAKAPSRKRAAIDLGLAYLVGKAADDLFEEGVKAAVSATATGGVTTAARYLGIGTGLLFFFGQRGRDVALPEYTEIEVALARMDAGDQAPGERPSPPPD